LGTKLVIVESPAKARKIGSFLGDDYVVEASVGHIRDLPQRAADIPKEYKKFAWAKEGVNIEEDFSPLYVIVWLSIITCTLEKSYAKNFSWPGAIGSN